MRNAPKTPPSFHVLHTPLIDISTVTIEDNKRMHAAYW